MGYLGVRRTRFWRSTNGAAAAEFAVLFPILAILIVGLVDFGRVYYTGVTVANAARTGAEYGSTDPANSGDTTGMRLAAQQDGAEAGTVDISARRFCLCGGSSASCTVLCGSGAAPEVYVEVSARTSFATLLPYPGLPGAFLITRKAIFRAQ
jgi:Flp pilus assembly protein TadG